MIYFRLFAKFGRVGMMRLLTNFFFDLTKIVFQTKKFAYDIFCAFNFSYSLRNSEHSF